MVDQVARQDSKEPPSFHIEGEEEGYIRSRLPSDLLRLVVALIAGLLGFLLASVLDNISVGITIEVVDAFDGLPTAMVVTAILAVQLVAWILPLLVIGLLLIWRRYRRLTLVLLAVVAAVAVAWGIQSELTARFATDTIEKLVTSWSFGLENLVLSLVDTSKDDQISTAEIGVKESVQQYKLAVLRAYEEVENTMINLASRRAQQKELEQQLTQLELVASHIDARLKEGMVSQLEVFESQRTLLNTKQDLLSS